jgi:acyl-CoA thioester hydrolase/thioesterase-3
MEHTIYASFESEIKVRPDDIDLNNHLHSTKYLDYMLAARFEQMRDGYKMPMEDFNARGFNWVANTFHIEYKRTMKLGDTAIVRTQIGELGSVSVNVLFTITNKATKKVCAEGYGNFMLISLASGRPVRIPADILEHYSLQTNQ